MPDFDFQLRWLVPLMAAAVKKNESNVTSGHLRPNRFHPVLAVAIYSAVSLACFGPRTLPQFWQSYRGLGADPTIHMWALSWWPYAIAHHLNPLITQTIFAPNGYNL